MATSLCGDNVLLLETFLQLRHLSGFQQDLENRENRGENNGQGRVREFYFGPKVRERSGNFYFRPKVRVLFSIVGQCRDFHKILIDDLTKKLKS